MRISLAITVHSEEANKLSNEIIIAELNKFYDVKVVKHMLRSIVAEPIKP